MLASVAVTPVFKFNHEGFTVKVENIAQTGKDGVNS